MQKPDLKIENKLKRKYNYINHIAGLDEAGRGAIAGPVVAAAVILENKYIDDLNINDSKKLSAQKREYIYKKLILRNIDFGIGIVNNDVIDEINILNATYLAFYLAVKQLRNKPDYLLIDGNRYNNNEINFECVVKGDSKSLSIAAASIIAKVSRDKMMCNFSDINLINYDFSSHKGYGTKKHFEAIKKYGTTYLHRNTFLSKFKHKEFELFTNY